jgi:predicted enzyme related to lactoylglutathione lyase
MRLSTENRRQTLSAAEADVFPRMLACAAVIAVILAGMEIAGLGRCGTRMDHSRELAQFYEHVLGLRLVHVETDFWVVELPDRRHVEVFGSRSPGTEHFATGPVVDFAVRDLPAAVDELRRAGIELLGEPGPTLQQFRGPDGNVYELVTS